MLNNDIAYCHEMLPRVSRTFAPTIKMLPEGLNVPVTVAYLLCRIADTVEDSAHLSVNHKQEMLEKFINIFDESSPGGVDRFMQDISRLPDSSPDENLVYNLPRIMNVFNSFAPSLRKNIAFWVVEMSRGMRKYAQSSRKRAFTFLGTMKDLDEYMYFVAGTVGYLLTELFSHYSSRITPNLKQRLTFFAESFGKGLQMVNIIRDMTTDLRRGQSYIPEELLLKYQLDRSTIFEQANADRARRLFNELVTNAVTHLDKALEYIVMLPKEERRIRLFCMLPLFWAMRTLQKIQENTLALLENEKIKVSRRIIKKEYYLALINMYSNRLTRWHYMRIKSRLGIPLSRSANA